MTHTQEDHGMGEVEYAELVARVRSTVAATIPPGTSVLVLSRGDAGLVEIPGLIAAHFPQDGSGGYAGYHPRDGAEAVAQLRQLRHRGAEYLVIPTTASWWLEFYEDFGRYLADHCQLVADARDACWVYRLGSGVANVSVDTEFARPRASIEQIRDYLENLLSTDTHVAVLESGCRLAGSLAPIAACALASEELEGEGDCLPELTRVAEGGADYLIVPRTSDTWLDGHPEIAARIEASCPKVADQRHLCRVYELRGLRP